MTSYKVGIIFIIILKSLKYKIGREYSNFRYVASLHKTDLFSHSFPQSNTASAIPRVPVSGQGSGI